MTWFAFTNGHPDIDAAGIEEKQLTLYGFHGYATQAEADARKNSVNLFQSALLDNLDAVHVGHAGTLPGLPGSVGGGGSVLPSIANPLTGVNAIGDFFSRLSQPHTWIRVGEFVAGAVILYVGLKALVTPAGANVGKRTVKHTISTVAKVAAK